MDDFPLRSLITWRYFSIDSNGETTTVIGSNVMSTTPSDFKWPLCCGTFGPWLLYAYFGISFLTNWHFIGIHWFHPMFVDSSNLHPWIDSSSVIYIYYIIQLSEYHVHSLKSGLKFVRSGLLHDVMVVSNELSRCWCRSTQTVDYSWEDSCNQCILEYPHFKLRSPHFWLPILMIVRPLFWMTQSTLMVNHELIMFAA